MAWVRGIREVRHVRVSLDGDLPGLRRGPVMTRNVRQKIELTPASWPYVLQAVADLPPASGAGPCGTYARGTCRRHMVDPNKFVGQRWTGAGDPFIPVLSPSPLAWSIRHLVEPLAAYYATYVEPLHFGAKSGPRGRRAA